MDEGPEDDVGGVEGELEELEEGLDSTGTKEGDGEVAGDGSPAFNDVYLFWTHQKRRGKNRESDILTSTYP